MLLLVGWRVVSELVKNPITAEQVLLQLLGDAITRRDLLINAFSGGGARSGWCLFGRSAVQTPGACWKKEAAKNSKKKLSFRSCRCNFLRQKTLKPWSAVLCVVPARFQLKALQVLPHLILSTIWLSAASEMILSSVLSKVMGWQRNSLLPQHKWVDMLTQQSYFHGGFNPIKPSVVVVEVFWFGFFWWFIFLPDLCTFVPQSFHSFTWDMLQT